MQSSIATADRSIFTATSRSPRHALKIAWNRDVDSGITFALVGTSVVGGKDIVKGTQSILTKADFFHYIDETDRVLKLETDRILEEPLGGIAYAQADITLDNTGLRFTPNVNSTVGTALIPNRPVKIYMGLKVGGTDKAVPNVYGLTGMPRENKATRTVEVHCFDYLKFIDQFVLESALYQDYRSDQIIDDLLVNKLGFSTDQYVLDTGLNLIPFAWFDKGTTAGDAIRRLCEAEEAVFYQDETGMLRFETRRKSREAPNNAYVWTINPEDILLWEEESNPIIINRCIVKSKPLTVQTVQEVWRDGITEAIGPGVTKEIWANFENPVATLTTPVAATDYSANMVEDFSGTVITSDISIVVTAFATSAKLEVTNNNASLAYVFLRLRGTPAINVGGEIQEIYEDSASISTYDRQELIVENDLITSQSFAHYMAKTLVNKYSTPRKILVLTVPAIPTLQLRDMVRVKDLDQGTYKNYRVMRIQSQQFPGQYTQTLRLREVFSGETDSWAVVGTAVVGDADEFVGV